MLATSRERLAVAGEHLVVVPPLSCTPDESGWRSEATDLFADRVQAAAPEAMVGIDPDELAALCTTLDGLPLAIELPRPACTRCRSPKHARRTRPEHLDPSGWPDHGHPPPVGHRPCSTGPTSLLNDNGRAALHGAAVFAGPFRGRGSGRGARHRRRPGPRAACPGWSSARWPVGRVRAPRSSTSCAASPSIGWLPMTSPSSASDMPGASSPRRRRGVGEELAVALDDAPVLGCERLLPDVRDALTTTMAPPRMPRPPCARWWRSTTSRCRPCSPRRCAGGSRRAELGDPRPPLGPGRLRGRGAGSLEARRPCGDGPAARTRTGGNARLGVGDRFGVLGHGRYEDLAHGRMPRGRSRPLRRGNRPVETDRPTLRRAEGRAAMAICLAYAHDGEAISRPTGSSRGLGAGGGARGGRPGACTAPASAGSTKDPVRRQ